MINIFKYNAQKGFVHEQRVAPEALSLAEGDFLWLDLEDPTDEEAEILRTSFRFHPLAVEDALVDNQYPKVDIYPDYLFLVVHGINYQAATRRFTTAEIDVFLGRQFLITHHSHAMRSVRVMMERIRKEPPILAQGLDVVLQAILDRMVDNYFPELERLDDRIEQVEQEVFEKPERETLARILTLKREVLHVKRIVYPQREVFNRLSRDELPWIRASTRLYFRDTYDSLFRMAETADSYRDLLSGLLDAYLSSVSNNLNQVMKVLTVIATICIPMTVVAGIYGMNFERMPELEWPYGYPFALGLMALIGVAMLVYFRRKKWI